MTNPTHYPSVNNCKRLTEIGFPKTELHYYNSDIYTDIDLSGIMYKEEEIYVCPSVMELLDVMPSYINEDCFLEINKTRVSYSEFYWIIESTPNALAEMVLWLVENKHISFTK